MRLRLACLALATAVIAAPALADPAPMEALADTIAEALDDEDIGRRAEANIFLQQPAGRTSRVPCPPLSRRLASDLSAALPDAFARHGRRQTRLVERQRTGPGQFLLLLTWSREGRELALSYRIGDLGSEQIATVASGSARLAIADLTPGEAACAAPLQEINELRTAETMLFVHREPSVHAQQIGTIPEGRTYRLLARMPYVPGGWALVQSLEGAAEADPFADTLGFAAVPLPAGAPAPAPLPAVIDEEIEVISQRSKPVCEGRYSLRVKVVQRGNGLAQRVRWYAPGETGSVGIDAGEQIAFAPDCAWQLVRTTRKLDLIAIFSRVQ